MNIGMDITWIEDVWNWFNRMPGSFVKIRFYMNFGFLLYAIQKNLDKFWEM